jgi:hypothetical protein
MEANVVALHPAAIAIYLDAVDISTRLSTSQSAFGQR